jgi:hypothetical protein
MAELASRRAPLMHTTRGVAVPSARIVGFARLRPTDSLRYRIEL